MKANMGSTDRLLRIVAAIILVILYFTGKVDGTMGTILLAVAGIFLLTSVLSFCPLYVPFGINTCKKK